MKPGTFDVVVTTYEAIIILINDLKAIKWEYLIFDEAHKLKNHESQISLKSRLIESKYRLLMTGTPLHNNLSELWALLNFLMPNMFKSSSDFDQWFDFASSKQ
jgi:SWI/SNF-related matrix-associated actin-dependent regulator of chromatin subfamily A member 5